MTSRLCVECMTLLKNEDDTNEYGIFQPCKCIELNNTLLMWGVLTYGAGFINWWIYANECGYCQSHANILLSDEYYSNNIVDMQTLKMIVNANPNIIHEKNANGATIFNIIHDVIGFIGDTIKTYEDPISTYNSLNDEIIMGKKHINELEMFRQWLSKGDTPLTPRVLG
jgi:hypothetical protein